MTEFDNGPKRTTIQGASVALRMIRKVKANIKSDPRETIEGKVRRLCTLEVPDLDPGLTSIRPYSSRWPELFVEERERITSVLAPRVGPVHVEHIGSTSIPGLDGKPIIDLLIGVSPASDIERAATTLEELSYQAYGLSPCDPEVSWLWRIIPDEHAFIVHLCVGTNPWISTAVNFRDYLRVHPEAKATYEARKHELADEGNRSLFEYSMEKLILFYKLSEEANDWVSTRRESRASAQRG